MKRFALAILVFAAACGSNSTPHNGDDDGGGDDDGSGSNMTSTCGDHVVDVATEECDDGNTVSGDGCSSTCKIEVVNKCGNGQLDTGETCDDGNMTDSDGCSHLCAVEMGYTCTGAPSVCTMMPLDQGSCAAPFALTLTMNGTAYNASAMGDTTTGTNQFDEASCDSFTSGGGNDHQYVFVNPVMQPVVITLNTDVDDTLVWDGAIRLTTAACDNTTAVPDDGPDAGANDGCADQHYSIPEQLEYTMLPAGTYYIDVDGYDDMEAGPYSLTIFAGMATCGNGEVEPGETCDDHNTANSDGCSSMCTVEAGYECTGSPSVCTLTCGNGMLDDGEDCDDGNTTAGDGCDATCQTEPGYDCGFDEPSVCVLTCGDGVLDDSEQCDVGTATDPHCNANCEIVFDTHEVTTNDDDAANAQTLTPTSQWIDGSFTVGDVDVYKFTLTATASVKFETFDQYDPANVSDSDAMNSHLFCGLGGVSVDTQVRLFNDPAKVSDNTMALAFDDDDGDSLCSYMGADNGDAVMNLPAGTYYVKLNLYSATKSAPLYGVQMTVTP